MGFVQNTKPIPNKIGDVKNCYFLEENENATFRFYKE